MSSVLTLSRETVAPPNVNEGSLQDRPGESSALRTIHCPSLAPTPLDCVDPVCGHMASVARETVREESGGAGQHPTRRHVAAPS